jgi:hypothetical protein
MESIDYDGADDLRALENFILDNDDLQQLEAELEQFNIFDAVGMVSQEIRHSHFLGFLLNPSENHGLGDAFLKRVLMLALSESGYTQVNLIDIDVNDMNGAVVKTEWEHIDILIVDETSKLVIAIENKIYSGEHSNQLARYREIVQQAYPDSLYVPIFIFLTLDETLPSDNSYIPLSYGMVATVLDSIRTTRKSMLSVEVATLIEHYTIMLRRHLVTDSKIAELCQKIWNSNHKKALEILIEHQPDLRYEINQYFIKEILEKWPDFNHESRVKKAVVFTPQSWDSISLLLTGQNWYGNGRLLRFWLERRSNGLSFTLYLFPSEMSIVRETIFEVVQRNPSVFNTRGKLNLNWQSIYTRNILKAEELEDAILEELKPPINEFWQAFLAHDLPVIRQVIENEIPWSELEQRLHGSINNEA